MDHRKGQVAGGAAAVYEEFFVPALFSQWPPRIADLLQVSHGDRALDVACGTGILAREFIRRLGSEHVEALDPNPAMRETAALMEPRLRLREGRAEHLPWDDASFDVVGCQFGLMFFDERVAALREMLRVLKPGGRLAVAVWGSLDETPGYRAMVEILEELLGPTVADELRVPYRLGDVQTLFALAKEGGLPAASVSKLEGQAVFPSIEDWVHTDIFGWTLADTLSPQQYERLLQVAKKRLTAFVRGGRVVFDAPAHVIHATALGGFG